MSTNPQSSTHIDEIADGIYRINTPISIPGGQFSFAPSEAFRQAMDYFAHAPQTPAILERFALESPTTLACMHGSAWRGDGAALLRALAIALT
jgi:hypothetical protein